MFAQTLLNLSTAENRLQMTMACEGDSIVAMGGFLAPRPHESPQHLQLEHFEHHFETEIC